MAPGRLASVATLLAATIAAGCSDDPETADTGSPAGASGSGGTAGCGAGEVAQGQFCQPAGVPPERCGAGFAPDGEGGCLAVMPGAPCQGGTLAVPGDTACREVATCADGKWGDLPVDASTQYVDAAASDGDGSADSPWPTIAQAVAAAAPGAVVALAAGSYHGDVSLQDKPVRLWGKCPAMVTIDGDGTRPAAVFIASFADGTEVRGIRIRGPMIGVGISGSKDVLLDQLWIDVSSGYGIAARQVIGDTSLTIARTLVTGAAGAGIIVEGAAVTVDAVQVRDTTPQYPVGDGGFGLFASADLEAPGRANLTVRGSAFLHNRASAIAVDGVDATIEASLFADTEPEESTQALGRGLLVQPDLATAEPSIVSIVSSVVERCRDVGISVEASEVTIEATVVRDMLPNANHDGGGRGLHVQANQTDPDQRAKLTLRDSLVHRAMDIAFTLTSSDATVERTLLRATQPRAFDGLFGDGLALASPAAPSTATVTSSRFEGQPRAGIATFGGSVSVSTTRFECNAIDLDGELHEGKPFTLQDLGGNACGCGDESATCSVSSSNLAPPEAL